MVSSVQSVVTHCLKKISSSWSSNFAERVFFTTSKWAHWHHCSMRSCFCMSQTALRSYQLGHWKTWKVNTTSLYFALPICLPKTAKRKHGHCNCRNFIGFRRKLFISYPRWSTGYHWTHQSCTVHPVVCYYKNS